MDITRRHCAAMVGVWVLAGCASGSGGLDRGQEEALNRKAGIDVRPAKGGIQMRLPEVVLFDSNQSTLRPGTAPVLARSAELLNRSGKQISIEGHTDNTGLRSRNQALSEARALAVGRAIIDLGVSPSRINYQGYASDRPFASNDTVEGRSLNRRTEIFLHGESMDTVMGLKE